MRAGDGRVVSNFIVQALLGEGLTVYGDGSQTRSFCYVSDEVEGIYRLFLSSEHEPVNIGNPDEYTVSQLAEVIQALVDPSVGVCYLPLPTDDPKVRQPDITRARTILGWQPEVSLADGLARTVEYFREMNERTALRPPPVIVEEEVPDS
jgi:dTDP-glucose 4,6-dehydratase